MASLAIACDESKPRVVRAAAAMELCDLQRMTGHQVDTVIVDLAVQAGEATPSPDVPPWDPTLGRRPHAGCADATRRPAPGSGGSRRSRGGLSTGSANIASDRGDIWNLLFALSSLAQANEACGRPTHIDTHEQMGRAAALLGDRSVIGTHLRVTRAIAPATATDRRHTLRRWNCSTRSTNSSRRSSSSTFSGRRHSPSQNSVTCEPHGGRSDARSRNSAR